MRAARKRKHRTRVVSVMGFEAASNGAATSFYSSEEDSSDLKASLSASTKEYAAPKVGRQWDPKEYLVVT